MSDSEGADACAPPPLPQETPSPTAATSSSAAGAQEGESPNSGPSLVFTGGGDFLAKYQHVFPAQKRDTMRNRTRHTDRDLRAASGPEPRNVQLNTQLVHAKTVEKVLQVVAAQMEHFNAVNLITALHRMATLVSGPRRANIRRDVRFKKLTNRFLELLRTTEVGQLKPQDLSNAAWALTKLGLLNAVLFNHLSEHSRRTIEAFEPVNLSMALWAFARAGFMEEKFFNQAAAEVKKQIRGFQPQQIANTTWAMAKSQFIDEELFSQAADFALEHLAAFQPMNQSMLLYSFALAKVRHEKLFMEVAKHFDAKALVAASSAPHVITNMALAYSEANMSSQEIFNEFAEAAVSMLHDFRTQQLSTLAQAFAAAGVKHKQLFSAISSAVVRRMVEFRHQDLQDLLAAYETLQMPTTQIVEAIDAQVGGQRNERNRLTVNLTLLLAIFCLVTLLWRLMVNPGSAATWF
mmetsp:Transcript_8599/g.15424  ORF Transcript_8599/g.15424 Transcript_8599/m.15424 type:complete len:463 (-) Transcript_8599:196-1584(-)